MHRVQSLEHTILIWKRRVSILIVNWRVSKKKVKETTVRTIIEIDIEIKVRSVIVIGGGKMIIRRSEIAYFIKQSTY